MATIGAMGNPCVMPCIVIARFAVLILKLELGEPKSLQISASEAAGRRVLSMGCHTPQSRSLLFMQCEQPSDARASCLLSLI